MKKIIVIFILLFVLFSFLFADEIKEEDKKLTFWETLGMILIVFFVGIIIGSILFITYTSVYGGRFDSGKIRIKTGEKLNLKLKELFETEQDELSVGFIVKRIFKNEITLQCKVCRGGKIILTKIIGVEKGKKVNTQIKKLLNYPIDISIRCSKSDDEDQIRINVERIVPITNTLPDSYSVNNWN